MTVRFPCGSAGLTALCAAWAVAMAGGCARPAHEPVLGAMAAKPVAVKRITNRPPNLNGVVFILEYHRVLPHEARWDRSVKRFRGDLERLYAMGFRPVTVSAFVEGRMLRPKPKLVLPQAGSVDWRSFGRLPRVEWFALKSRTQWPTTVEPAAQYLPPGAMPVIFTFDDSDPSQFSLRADGTLDPNCALGVWAQFAATHRDFPVRATFYVLPAIMWRQKHMRARKLEMLKAWGCELGSHTMNHRSLRRLTDAEVKRELARSIDYIAKLGFKAKTLATPFGVAPKNRSLLKGFWWHGKHYGFEGVLLGGGGPTFSRGDPRFNPYRLLRTQGIDAYLGLSFWLKQVKRGRVHPFVAP